MLGGPVATPDGGQNRGVLRLSLLLVAILILALGWRAGHLDTVLANTAQLRRELTALGPGLAVTLVAGTFALATLALVPGAPMATAAGALLGSKLGLAAVLLGANVGANLAFLLSRSLAFDTLRRNRGQWLSRLDRHLRERGILVIAWLRMSGMVPLLSYGAGLTRLRWRDYAVGNAIGSLPTSLFLVYLGSQIFSGSGAIWVAAAGLLLLASLALYAARHSRDSRSDGVESP